MPETLLAETADKILTITLNRPKRLNALSPTLLRDLKQALDEAVNDDAVSVVVIKSAGRAFCVGYDLNEEDWITSQYPADYPDGVDQAKDREDIDALLAYWMDMWRFPKPIICQVQGACLSGGGELLAVSDLVVASEDASFGHPAGRDLGIPPTVFFWPLLIGMRKAKEMLYTARSMDAHEAERAGLLNKVVPADQLEEATRALALDIAKTPADHLAILKQSANNFYDQMGVDEATARASQLDAEFHQSPVFLEFFRLVREEGMEAALERRKELFG